MGDSVIAGNVWVGHNGRAYHFGACSLSHPPKNMQRVLIAFLGHASLVGPPKIYRAS